MDPSKMDPTNENVKNENDKNVPFNIKIFKVFVFFLPNKMSFGIK